VNGGRHGRADSISMAVLIHNARKTVFRIVMVVRGGGDGGGINT